MRDDTVHLTELSDDALKNRYTVMLVVRMSVFGHLPPSGEPLNPVVDGSSTRWEPCLDTAYGEADRRGWEPTALREAARQVLSPPMGSVVDPVAIFRAD